MKVAIFNVGFSPNLGDGVIADCIHHEIQRRTGWLVQSIDLSGRLRPTAPGSGTKRLAKLTALQSMPRWLGDRVVTQVLGRTIENRLRPQWRRLLEGAGFAVFGGGQLFQDGDLNFPLKLAAAVSECHRRDLPCAIFAVGAAPVHSARGRNLLRTLTRSPRLVGASARDDASCAALRQLGVNPKLARDPGLLAAGVWRALPRRPRLRKTVGLGITHPRLLAHHGSGAVAYRQAKDIYRETICSLQACGFDVLCFTNGAAEDERLLGELARGFAADECRDGVSIAPRCKSPADLAALIAGCDAVVAHRLHAAILAYAYRVPSVGISWDPKLQAFFTSVGRDGFIVGFEEAPDRIGSLVRGSLCEGIDPVEHAHVVAEAHAAIDDLVSLIQRRGNRDSAGLGIGTVVKQASKRLGAA